MERLFLHMIPLLWKWILQQARLDLERAAGEMTKSSGTDPAVRERKKGGPLRRNSFPIPPRSRGAQMDLKKSEYDRKSQGSRDQSDSESDR